MTYQIAEAFILGLIGGAVPGPILTATFTEILNKDFVRSLIVALKALLAETLLAGLILLFFFSWDIPTAYFHIISFVGAIVLFWLAGQVWRIEKVTNDEKEVFSFTKLLLLTIGNGGLWIFWITICVPRAFELNKIIAGGHLLFLLFCEIGWLITVVILAYVFSKFKPLLQRKQLVSTVFRVFALILAFFGLKSIWGSLLYLLS